MSNEEEWKKWVNAHERGWSEWLALDERSIPGLPEYPGIYEVRTKDYSFPRLSGVTSILYIGCTDKRGLKKRITSLVKGRHVARKRIKRVADELTVELEFRFKVDSQAELEEKNAIQKYEAEHLELPPCNHKLPR